MKVRVIVYRTPEWHEAIAIAITEEVTGVFDKPVNHLTAKMQTVVADQVVEIETKG